MNSSAQLLGARRTSISAMPRFYESSLSLCSSSHRCSLIQAVSANRNLIIMSINQSARRRSSSTSAFALSSITQMRPRWSSDAWQEAHYRPVLSLPRQNLEQETKAHSNPSTVERDSKSSGSSNVSLATSTSLNNSIMYGYPSAQRVESAKEQSEDPPLTQFRTTISGSWMWEILALLFSILCMSAIIAVLAFEDGKQVDQWGM